MSNKDNNKKRFSIIKTLRFLVPEFWKTSKLFFIISCLGMLTASLLSAGTTLLNQRFLENATDFASGSTVIRTVILSLIALSAVEIGIMLINHGLMYCDRLYNDKLDLHFRELFYDKIAKVSAINFEDTEKLDTINKAEFGIYNIKQFVLQTVGEMVLYQIPYLIFISWYVITLSPLLVLALLAAFIPALLSQIVRLKMYSRTEDASAPYRRQQNYYDSCITDRKYFKETRLLGAFSFFREKYVETIEILRKLSIKLCTKDDIITLVINIVTIISYTGVLILLFMLLMSKKITVGAFSAVYISIGRIFSAMNAVFNWSLSSIMKSLPYVGNYVDFFDFEDDSGKDIELSNDFLINVENMSFCYPSASRDSLSDVSFTVKKGETIAIVGENGSGKSTLIKLLIGFYKPTGGDIKYNGVSTKDISFSCLTEKSSAVFQKYCQYQMSLRDNIIIGDIRKEATDEEMRRACAMSGFTPEEAWLPDGFDTMLSREFKGIQLSGGQAQRVAIARAFYRDSEIVILDEPTAAIDPFEETKIYNRFANLSKGKTAFLITHRLGSVKLADRIIVMNDGKVDDIGTHEELMARGGEYRRMFEAQSQWYKSDE